MSERRVGRRPVSTRADGTDIPEKPTTVRQRVEVANEQHRRELQAYKATQAVRRIAWQARLERRSLAVEAERELHKTWGIFA